MHEGATLLDNSSCAIDLERKKQAISPYLSPFSSDNRMLLKVIGTFRLYDPMQAKVDDLAIAVQNASSVAGHLRFMDKNEVLHKLERLSSERQKFSFQPFITGPYSAINIIMERMCKARLVQKQ